jgi:hypothetical protein
MENAEETGAIPACPHCGHKPVGFRLTNIVFPNDQIAQMLYCSNLDCCKVISIQIVGVQPSAVESVIKKIGQSRMGSA